MPWNKLSDVAIHSQADTVKKHEQFHGGLKAGLAALVILTATYFRYIIRTMSLHVPTCVNRLDSRATDECKNLTPA